jgi:hypothetical protein
MADDNKISIDVNISGDGQKQIDTYVKSFDSLRNSINGLSQPFNSFSNNLNTLDKNLSKYTESLSKLNDQHNDVTSSSDKMYDKVTNASSSFVLWNEVVKVFSLTLKGWGIALSGGLGIITAFLPEIINFAKALFTGKDALNAMVLNFKNLNDVMKDSNKEASSEITRLQILYRSATDVNNSYGDRIKSVQELKKEFPTHLKNLSDEDILNGKAKKNYDELSKAIFENARARAALSKIENLAAQQLDIDFQKQKIINAKNAEYKRIEPEKVTIRGDMGERVPEMLSPKAQQKSLKDQQQTNRDLLRDELRERDGRKRLLQNQIDFLISFAGGNNKIAQAINNTQTPPVIPPTKKKTNPKPKAPKPDTPRSEDLVAAQSITITQHFENEKKAYDNELALLNDQLSKKLISQAAYNKQSQFLQD